MNFRVIIKFRVYEFSKYSEALKCANSDGKVYMKVYSSLWKK